MTVLPLGMRQAFCKLTKCWSGVSAGFQLQACCCVVDLANALPVGDENVAVGKWFYAPRTRSRKRPKLVAVGVVLDDLSKVHMRDEERSGSCESCMSELAMDADRLLGGKRELLRSHQS